MKAKYIFLAASALLLGSCSDIEEFVGGTSSQNEITFGDSFVGKAHTRAAATGDLSSKTLKNFPVKVWGEKYSGTAYNKDNATTVFDGTKLTYSADGDVWAYEGDGKKWEDFNYDFVGFAPFESTATATYTEGKATVSGVPLVQEIKNESGALSGEDYLLSKVTTSKNGSKREAVSLTFDHILSRLTLKAYTSLSEQYKVTLNSLQLYTPTMSATGSATYKEAAHEGPDKDQDTWTWTGFTNIDNATSAEALTSSNSYTEQEMVNAAITTADASASTGIELDKGESAAKQLSKEFFVAPTKGQTVTFYVKATYTVAFANGSDSKQYTKFVKVDALKDGLVQGYQHNLFIDINPKAIAFHVYAVEGWQLDNFSNDFINEKGKSFGFDLTYDQINAAITGILHAKANYLTNGNDKYLQYSVASIAKDGDASKVSTSGNTMTIDGWYSSEAAAKNQYAADKEDKASVSHAYAHFTIEPDYDFLGTAGTGDYVVSIKNNMNDVNTAKINIPTVKQHWFTMTATPEQFHVKVVAKCGGNEPQSFTAANASFGLVGATAGKVAKVSAIEWYANAEGTGDHTTAWSKTNRYAHFTVTPDASNFTQSGGNYTLKLTNNFSESQSQSMTFKFAEMKFTIKTTSSNQTFEVPLKTGDTPAAMAIVWGDNKTSANDLTSISLDNSKHTYDAVNSYQIRILSTETDATKQQIPEFNFGKYPSNTISGFKQNANGELLYSVDSPVLYSGETSINGMFYGSDNLISVSSSIFVLYPNVTNMNNVFAAYTSGKLASIPADLFVNNTKVTSFTGIFSYQKKLTTIPSGLFDKNTAVTTFSGAFSNCTSLVTIPSGLFAYQESATNFSSLFQGCTNAKLVSDLFIAGNIDKTTRFKNAPDKIDFSSVFARTGKDRSSDKGTAPDLWNYTYAKGCGFRSNYVPYYNGTSNEKPTYYTNTIPTAWYSTSSSSSTSFTYLKK